MKLNASEAANAKRCKREVVLKPSELPLYGRSATVEVAEPLGVPLDTRVKAGWLVGLRPVTYEVATLEKGGGPFHGYSGLYQLGDRVVTPPDGAAWRVVAVEQPVIGTSGKLDCEPWRRKIL